MAAEKTPPEFVLVESLRPGMSNLNLTLKVLEATEVLNKRHPDGSSTTISECVAGDASGTITLTARNKQAALCTPGATVTVRNGKIDMFKGTMRLAVDKWEPSRPRRRRGRRAVKTDYNLAPSSQLVASDE